MNKGCPKYTFYDGPPFATGLPHYGHIAAGTIKDVVTRYAHQNGFDVERRFGWDCHGLPIEFEIDKMEGIKTKKDVMAIGIEAYNAKCRSIVMRYSTAWNNIVTRTGRWIDFEDDYKTMDLNFMESVWWTFKQIYEKGLVYRSSRVMPYSCGCNTVLSNFEANMNYLDRRDPSLIVSFPLLSDPNTAFLAWTTTPWTLPANLALAVNPTMDYVKFQPENSEKIYICLEALLKSVLKDIGVKQHSVIQKYKGAELVGLEYEPLFNYFNEYRERNCFKVYPGSFVTSETGTGIVHCAPYGEEDFSLFIKEGLIRPENPPDALDENGIFTSIASDLEGVKFSDAYEPVKQLLKEKGRLMYAGIYDHSYPFCWRSNTPLIYRPVKSWFIKVESVKEDLLKNNMQARWVPAAVQEKRFHNWLQDAKDWCFSRSRFWGNPIPLWVSEDFEEVVCVGSVQELKELTGVDSITDLHRESIDHLTIPSKTGRGVLRRIEEVFDCWFESGAMPYAQCHYPFSTSPEEFKERFPADFIAEGLDQTRGWFYTLVVLGTCVFNQNPFKNLIVNGLVLAEDGTKMSKSKLNYTDPVEIIEKEGADAVRLYLVSSQLVRAEPLKFKDLGVREVVRDVFLPWYNAYRFFIQNANRYEASNSCLYKYDPESIRNTTNYMDRWIVAASQNLIKTVRFEMENYRLYTVVPALLKFLNDLTNWYVKLNRKRIKETNPVDTKFALDILYDSLFNVCLLMAPFTPFITELIYQNLSRGLPEGSPAKHDSIHYVRIPQFSADLLNTEIEASVSRMQTVIELCRKIRDTKKIALKIPVNEVKILHRDRNYLDSLVPLIPYIKEELNCFNVTLEEERPENVSLTAIPNNVVLGGRLKKQFTKALITTINNLPSDLITEFEVNKTITVQGVQIQDGELFVRRTYKDSGNPDFGAAGDNDVVVVVDCKMNEELLQVGTAREFANHVQKLRKASGLQVEDDIVLYYSQPGQYYGKLLADQENLIRGILKIPILHLSEKSEDQVFIAKQEIDHEEEKIEFSLYWKTAPISN